MILLEPMGIDDIPAVLEVEMSSFSTPWSESAFHEELKNPLAHYMVAKWDGKVVGYMGYWHILEEGHITNVAVHKDYRHQGIGAQLVEGVLLEAVKGKIARMTLEVRVSNEAARHLYESFGFKESGCRKGFYEQPREDGLIYWLEF